MAASRVGLSHLCAAPILEGDDDEQECGGDEPRDAADVVDILFYLLAQSVQQRHVCRDRRRMCRFFFRRGGHGSGSCTRELRGTGG